MKFQVKRRKPRYKELEEKYGGKWHYNRHAFQWECSDGRYVTAVACSNHDDVCNCLTQYYIYGGEKTELVWWR